MNRNYRIGRKREHRNMRLLEKAGFTCLLSARSQGLWDIVAYNAASLVFVQVNNKLPTAAELQILRQDAVPPNATKLLHRWRSYSHAPQVQEIT